MYTQPIIMPFDIEGRIYVLEDEFGDIVGTGRREACAALIELINRAKAGVAQEPEQTFLGNIRSAIVI